MYFNITLTNVLLCLLYIIPGYIVCKMKKATASHLKTMSAVLMYAGTPCMIANSFLGIEFTKEGFFDLVLFFLLVSIIQIIFMLALYFIFRKKHNDGRYRVLTVASGLGNLGYFGLPLVQAVFNTNEVTAYASIYVVSMNLILFTLGIFLLTKRKELVTVKSALINPATLGLAVGLIFYFTGLNKGEIIPTDNLLFKFMGMMSQITLPLSMIILGIRLASMKLKDIFLCAPAYMVAVGKLIVFPLFAYFCVVFLPISQMIKAVVLVLSATPCAASVMSMAELYENEEKMSANSVMMTTLLSFITIPIITPLL